MSFHFTEGAMSSWDLTDKQSEALDDLRFSTSDKALFRNATIILMSAAGRSKPSIADDLGCSVGTVDIIRRRYREQGLAGLAKGKPPGRVSRGHGRVSGRSAASRGNAAAVTGIRLQRLVAGPAQRPLGQSNEDFVQRRPVGTDHARRRVFGATAQAHDEGKAGRGGVRPSRRELKRMKKGRWPKIAPLS
jgi:Homeodomain-like domain